VEVIENPVLNSPYKEPTRHFRFSDEGITNEIVEDRRSSSYFVPIPKPKKKGAQLAFDTEWIQDRVEENAFINRVRFRVARWRLNGYTGVTKTTRQLLDYWTNQERERKLFFCQIEALETAIYITEVANRSNDTWIQNTLREVNENANPLLSRMALKMATGSGKTVVMAMLIVWQALNKLANPQDNRFSDAFLVVSPGITIRDRLRVLLPTDPNNYYRERDILPPEMMQDLFKAKVAVTNFHAFKPREHTKVSKLGKSILNENGSNAFTESPDQMVRRVLRDLGAKKSVVVLNDEAHHCYRRKPEEGVREKLTGDDRQEAKQREEEARVWISGLEAIQKKVGIKQVYDLSATPFFLRGSGYSEGTLFPWVVSDFSLIDAIESGIVKVPRVPVSDDSMSGDQPTYRNLWLRIRADLPKKGRKTDAVGGEPNLPVELEGAIQSLYGNYRKYYENWDQSEVGGTPPVMIIVCNNTNVSKLVYDYIAGWEKRLDEDNSVVVPGKLDIFNNEENGGWTARPNTILIDSTQLESGEGMSANFKKAAAAEIAEFKAEYRQRFQGRGDEEITDEDLLREVMNTVGKQGRLGERVKCVVSVSMLTEGWDANTVTHILGVRAFSTQLLCEQVVGRGLRRTSYAADADGMLEPEYAEVYGVPFSFIPSAGSQPNPKPKPVPTRVRALEDRIEQEITVPRLLGYRYEVTEKELTAEFSEDSRMPLSSRDIPFKTENAPIVGKSSMHTLDDLKLHREQEVAFLLSKLVLEKYFRSDGSMRTERTTDYGSDSEVQVWLFPQILRIARRWMNECVTYKDGAFPQLLMLVEPAHEAADKIYHAIAGSGAGERRLKPILRPYDTVGTTRYVDFDTTRPVYVTDPEKCHISHVVADTESWEQKMAQVLEDMDEVVRYAKNHNLGFTIPYTIDGEERNYTPDFVAHIDDGHGPDDLLNLIIEVSGEKRKDKEAKVSTARTLWVPAVNNHGEFGRWAFVEISDPWDAQNTIRGMLESEQPAYVS
jgi:type III restriction enzyme